MCVIICMIYKRVAGCEVRVAVSEGLAQSPEFLGMEQSARGMARREKRAKCAEGRLQEMRFGGRGRALSVP